MTPTRAAHALDRLAPFLLAVPFLIVIAVYRGLQVTFSDGLIADERFFHYPTILRFANEWPRIDLTSYQSVTTPLFHVLMATVVQLTGPELYKLRLVNVLLSYGAIVAFYRLLRIHFAEQPSDALLQALALTLVPYYFTNCFVLMTDGLSWLLVFLTLMSSLRLVETRRGSDQWLVALLFSLAVLTRQSSISLLPLILLLLGSRWGWIVGRLWSVAVSLIIALLPFVALMLLWQGTVPREMAQAFVASSIVPKPLAFMMSLVGLYFPFYVLGIVGDGAGLQRNLSRSGSTLVVALVLAVGFLLVAPMPYTPSDFGVLWRISAFLPELRNTSLLFWPLLALGLFGLLQSIGQPARMSAWLAPTFLMLYGLPYLRSSVITQRHFEATVIVFFSFAVSSRTKRLSRVARWSIAVLCVISSLFIAMRFVFGV